MPKPTDGTSFWEQVYKISSEEFADMGEFLIANESPRPFGSEKVPPKEEDLTYTLMRKFECLFRCLFSSILRQIQFHFTFILIRGSAKL